MALIPFAEHKLIPAGDNDPEIIPIGIIWHVDAGNAADLHDYFKNRSGGIESHGHIRKDGHLYQYRDSTREADANYRANSFVVNGKRYGFLSFETQGLEMGEWTDQQLATMKRVMEWGRDTHNIPLVVCPGPFKPGVGYHTLWGAPSDWTPVSKSCPGPERKAQFHRVLVPWMDDADGSAKKEPWPVLGERSKRVSSVTRRLKRLGYISTAINHFNPKVKNAVAAFQRDVPELSTDADGAFGPLTWATMWKPELEVSAVQPGKSGYQVRFVQGALNIVYPGANLEVDGKFGKATEELYKRFEVATSKTDKNAKPGVSSLEALGKAANIGWKVKK